MTGIRLTHSIEGSRRVLRLLGTFDGSAAREVLGFIRSEPEMRDIVIDVAGVRGFDEVGVAALARLSDSIEMCRIALRGLSAPQLRILRYLGRDSSLLLRRAWA